MPTIPTQEYVQLPGYNPNPVPVEPPVTGSIVPDNMPEWLAYLIAIGVVGATAEGIAHFNQKAAYTFVGLVLLGFIAAKGRADNFKAFFDRVNSIAKGVK